MEAIVIVIVLGRLSFIPGRKQMTQMKIKLLSRKRNQCLIVYWAKIQKKAMYILYILWLKLLIEKNLYSVSRIELSKSYHWLIRLGEFRGAFHFHFITFLLLCLIPGLLNVYTLPLLSTCWFSKQGTPFLWTDEYPVPFTTQPDCIRGNELDEPPCSYRSLHAHLLLWPIQFRLICYLSLAK